MSFGIKVGGGVFTFGSNMSMFFESQNGPTEFLPSEDVPPIVVPDGTKVEILGSGDNMWSKTTFPSGVQVEVTFSTDPRVLTYNGRVDMKYRSANGETPHAEYHLACALASPYLLDALMNGNSASRAHEIWRLR